MELPAKPAAKTFAKASPRTSRASLDPPPVNDPPVVYVDPPVAKPASSAAKTFPPVKPAAGISKPGQSQGKPSAAGFGKPATGFVKPAASGVKPAQGLVKPAAPTAKPSGSLAAAGFKKPAAGQPGSISTLRNKWEHTTSSAPNVGRDSQVALAEKKNLRTLLLLYKSSNVKQQSLAQEIIENLRETSLGDVALDPSVKNGFRPLVDLTKFNEEDAQIWAMWALANLAAYAPNQEKIMNEVGWHNIKTRYLVSPLPEVQIATASLLENLSREAKNQEGIVTKGAPVLLDLIRESQSAEVRASCLRALATMSSIKDHGGKDLWVGQLLELTLPSVMDEANPEVQAAAVQVLANTVSDDDPIALSKAYKSGSLDLLINLLGSDSPELQVNSATAIAHIAKLDSGLKDVVSFGGCSAFVRLLDSTDQQIQYADVNAINILADYGPSSTRLLSDGVVEPLKELIFATPNIEVEELAMKALYKLDNEAWKYVEQRLIELPKANRENRKSVNPEALDAMRQNAADDAERHAQDSSRAARIAQEDEERQKRLREEEQAHRRSLETAAQAEKKRLEEAAHKRQQEEERLAKLDSEKRKREEELLKLAEAKRKGEEEVRKQQELMDARRREEEARYAREREESERKLKDSEEKRRQEEQARIRALEEKLALEEARLNQMAEEKRRKQEAERAQRDQDEARQRREDEDRRRIEDEERKRMLERLGKEEQIEQSRLSLMRQADEDRRKLDEERRKLADERHNLERFMKQREEEDKLRAEKEKMEKELAAQRAAIEKARFEEEHRKEQERLKDEQARLHRLKNDLDLERQHMAEEKQRAIEEAAKLHGSKLTGEREIIAAERRALEDEKKRNAKLLQEREEEDRLRAERIRGEQEFEHQKLLLEQKKMMEEQQRAQARFLEEQHKLEKLRAETDDHVLASRPNMTNLSNISKEWQDRIAREKGDLELEILKARAWNEERLKLQADREALERAQHALNEERARLNIELQNARGQNDIGMTPEQVRENIEFQRLRREEGGGRRQENDAPRAILADSMEKGLNLGIDADELIRLQKQNLELTDELEKLRGMDDTQRRELEAAIAAEADEKRKLEEQRRLLEETERSVRTERQNVDLQKQAILSLLEESKFLDPDEAQKKLDDEIERQRQLAEDEQTRVELEEMKLKFQELQGKATVHEQELEETRKLIAVEKAKADGLVQELADREEEAKRELIAELANIEREKEALERDKLLMNDRENDINERDAKIKDLEDNLAQQITLAREKERQEIEWERRSPSRSRSRSRSPRRRDRRRSRRSPSRSRSPSMSASSYDSYTEDVQDERDRNYANTNDQLDGGFGDDNTSVSSIEGLAESDPHAAARNLVKALKGDSTRRMNEPSMETLRKFARGKASTPSQFEAREIIPVLVSILNLYTDPSHEEIIKTALLILAILAYNKDANQLYIRRANGGPTFVEILSFPSPGVRSRAALALAAYVLNNDLIKKECAGSIQKLTVMLGETDEHVKRSVCAALASLSDANKYNQRRVRDAGGVRTAMRLIEGNAIPPKYALNLVSALARDRESIQNEVRKQYPGVFRKIVRLLTPYTKPRILYAAVDTLVELARKNRENQKAIREAGAVPFLLEILTQPNPPPGLIASCLYLCWVISRTVPMGLQASEFRNSRGTMKEILATLKGVEDEQVSRLIAKMERGTTN